MADIRVRFGRAIRHRRQKLGVSQEEFGDMCGLDRTYIGGIERGERNVALLNIEKIARDLGFHFPKCSVVSSKQRKMRWGVDAIDTNADTLRDCYTLAAAFKPAPIFDVTALRIGKRSKAILLNIEGIKEKSQSFLLAPQTSKHLLKALYNANAP